MNPWEAYRERLETLHSLGLNLDLERHHAYTAEAGWNIDHYQAELPPEPPGEPVERGSFQAAQAILRDYRFPPPDLIVGIFRPHDPLERREMLLKARFLGLLFYFGVRVGGVVDSIRDGKQGLERVWGYDYATLEGYFERAQIEFTVVKNLHGGQVCFRIDSFARTGMIRNPFYWLGFRVFARRLQRRFAQQSMQRMQRLVQEALAGRERPGSWALKPETAEAVFTKDLPRDGRGG
ncbi:MAG TPA: DUF1990 family protein [Meiothermus sp.]|nr:DUF1990 family protein [Meiothermus sp.]